MDNIVLKLIDSIKIPGIIIAIIYFIYQFKIISIIKSSEIEKLFFTHEKNMIYRAFNWITLFFASFILLVVISFAIWFLIPSCKFITLPSISIAFDILFVLVFIVSIILFFKRNKQKVSAYLNRLNNNRNKLWIVYAIYCITIILTISYSVAVGVYSLKDMDSDTQKISIILCAALIALLLPDLLKTAISPWSYKEKTMFSFIENEIRWYIIKSVKDNDFLIGDSYKEDDCKTIRFISYDDIKKKEISIIKLKLP